MLVPAGILASLIVGAGMFSLPHVFVRTGVVYGLIALLFFTWVSISLNARYAKIIDQNGTNNRFAGYAKKYLGQKGYVSDLIFALGGIVFALTVYIALAASFFTLVFPLFPAVIGALAFWVIGTIIVFLGAKNAFTASLTVFVAMTAIIIFFGLFALVRGGVDNLTTLVLFDYNNLFLPFGPLLFALSGRAALSSVREGYKEKEYSLQGFQKAIRLGVIIPAIIYIVFVVAVIALSPQGVTPDSVTGLTALPAWGLAVIGILGLLAILDSYVLLGMEFTGIVSKDIGRSRKISYLLLAIIPIAIYFLGTSDFLILVGITGGIFLAIESIMVILMGKRAFGNSLSDGPLLLVFFVGIIYVIAGLF